MMTIPQSALSGNPPLAGAMRRAFSRFFDLWWECMLVFLLFAKLFPLLNLSAWWQAILLTKFATAFCLPLVMLIDSAVFAAAGNTPGKALLRLSVRKQDGAALQPVDYLRRNLSFWLNGMALGIPFISMVTMLWQLGRIAMLRPTGYDLAPGYQVVGVTLGWKRYLGFGVAWLLIFGVDASFVFFGHRLT